MSLQKHRKTESRIVKDKLEEDMNNFIIERVRRIDGQETIRKYQKCGLLGKGGFANCFITENMETKRRAATKII
jgi:hypothetical protein